MDSWMLDSTLLDAVALEHPMLVSSVHLCLPWANSLKRSELNVLFSFLLCKKIAIYSPNPWILCMHNAGKDQLGSKWNYNEDLNTGLAQYGGKVKNCWCSIIVQDVCVFQFLPSLFQGKILLRWIFGHKSKYHEVLFKSIQCTLWAFSSEVLDFA